MNKLRRADVQAARRVHRDQKIRIAVQFPCKNYLLLIAPGKIPDFLVNRDTADIILFLKLHSKTADCLFLKIQAFARRETGRFGILENQIFGN